MRKPGNPRRVRVEVTASEAVALKRKRQHNALFNKGIDAAARALGMRLQPNRDDPLIAGVLLSLGDDLRRLRRDV